MWTNYNGEKVEFNGTIEEGLAKNLNYNCIDCIRCTGCRDCTNCIRCNDCNACRSCISCVQCTTSYNSVSCYESSNLHGCVCTSLCDSEPVHLMLGDYSVIIRKNGTMRIGCMDYPIETWKTFTRARVYGEGDGTYSALFMDNWKPILESIISTLSKGNYFVQEQGSSIGTDKPETVQDSTDGRVDIPDSN